MSPHKLHSQASSPWNHPQGGQCRFHVGPRSSLPVPRLHCVSMRGGGFEICTPGGPLPSSGWVLAAVLGSGPGEMSRSPAPLCGVCGTLRLIWPLGRLFGRLASKDHRLFLPSWSAAHHSQPTWRGPQRPTPGLGSLRLPLLCLLQILESGEGPRRQVWGVPTGGSGGAWRVMPLGLCRTGDQRVPLPYFPDGPVGGVAAQETGCTAEPGLAFLRTLRSARRAVHLPLSPPSRALVWGCAPRPLPKQQQRAWPRHPGVVGCVTAPKDARVLIPGAHGCYFQM